MARRDGIDTLRALLDDFPDLLIVIHSAYAQYKFNFITWGAQAYIIKSSDPGRLVSEVNKVIGTLNEVA